MTMYLLLRNNKQSGPYSLDELKTMGLKAYDLVWVEGKSAAWRYPCEIEELSAFAPAVEEQPFDRFYKKASPVKNNTNSPVLSGEPSTVPGKRIIYVTMPAGRQPIPITAPALNNRSSGPEPTSINQGIAPEPAPASYKPTPARVTYGFEDNSSQLSPEETSVVEFLPRPKNNRSNRIVRSLAVGLSILALLAAGIFIGLSINNNSRNKDTRNKDTRNFQPTIAGRISDADNGQQDHTTAQQLPVPAVKNDPVPVNINHQPDTVATIIGQTIPAGPPAIRPPRVSTAKEKPANSKTQALPPSPAKDSSVGVVPGIRRDAVHRTDVEEKPVPAADKDADIKASIPSQVSVGVNGYTVGTFGGIADLQLTVTNRSVYPLDLVVVEVQYIQANKKIYKTENLYFRGIGAGSALMQEAPKSSRGIKVQYKITLINSKELGLSYSGI